MWMQALTTVAGGIRREVGLHRVVLSDMHGCTETGRWAPPPAMSASPADTCRTSSPLRQDDRVCWRGTEPFPTCRAAM